MIAELVISAALGSSSASPTKNALLKAVPGNPVPQYLIDVSSRSSRLFSPGNTVFSCANITPELILPKELRSLAIEAMAQLKKFFSADDDISIRESMDPDAEGTYSEFFIVVLTKKSPENAVRLLDEFTDSWWIDRFDPSGRLNVTVEYRI